MGCILVGRTSFDQYKGVIYPLTNVMNIVLTSQDRQSDDESVRYVSTLDEALEIIQELGFDRFVIAGGASVIRQCLDRQLVDKMLVSLHPYMFGEGLSITGQYTGNITLKFEDVKRQHEDFILLEYSVRSYY